MTQGQLPPNELAFSQKKNMRRNKEGEIETPKVNLTKEIRDECKT